MEEYIKNLKKLMRELKRDIAEEIPHNRKLIGEFLDNNKASSKESRLNQLIEAKHHYFDEGYICSYTPEELDRLIQKEITNLEKEERDAIN